MKYNYDEYPGEKIHGLYYRVFGDFFFRSVNDCTDHRQEVIDCIESGIPQDENTIGGGRTEEDGVPGVDFVL